MNTARHIAEYILTLANPDIGEIISNLKLQKLLYYAQGIHLAAFDTALFEEEIQAWRYGPVVENVYHDYKIYGSGAIFVPTNSIQATLTTEVKRFIENIYAYYGQYSASKLMQMTHEELPWRTTRDSEIISKDKIKSFFKNSPLSLKIANPSQEERLKNAALLLLSDYENDEELTLFTSIDSDDFYDS